MKLIDIVKDKNVHFLRYRKNTFYYFIETDEGVYTFPVPLEDIGDATLKGSDTALYFMRYIRKAIDEGTWLPLGLPV